MFRKSGKHIFGLTIITSVVIWILGVIFAGNNSYALDLPSGSWSVIYDTATPAFKLDSDWNTCRNSSDHNYWITGLSGYHTFHIYAGVECNVGNVYHLQTGDILIYQISAIDGSIDLPSGIVAEPNVGFNLLGFEVSNTADDSSIYTFYVYYNGTAGTFDDLVDIGLYYRNYDNWGTGATVSAVSVFRNSSGGSISPSDLSTINSQLSNCNNQQGGSDLVCVTQSVKKWIYDIWAQLNNNISPAVLSIQLSLSGLSSTVSNIATNVSDIEDILDNLDTSIQDIADNSDEELETNKTEKSNIENQTPQNAGLEGDYSKTTSLITAVSTVVSDLGNISAGDSCVISGNLGNWDGVGINMGDLDLCSLPVPVYVSTGLSLVLVVILIGLMISLIRLMIATFYASVPTGA